MTYRYLEAQRRPAPAIRRWVALEMTSGSDDGLVRKAFLTKRGARKYVLTHHWASLDA